MSLMEHIDEDTYKELHRNSIRQLTRRGTESNRLQLLIQINFERVKLNNNEIGIKQRLVFTILLKVVVQC